MAARNNLNAWNNTVANSTSKFVRGRNGIIYEYIVPNYGRLDKYYMDAIDVRSHKSPTSKYKNGKKPGQYQPIGDKTYFTFYQLKQLKKKGYDDTYIDLIKNVLERLGDSDI
jgi:hypothetical protein